MDCKLISIRHFSLLIETSSLYRAIYYVRSLGNYLFGESFRQASAFSSVRVIEGTISSLTGVTAEDVNPKTI
jgi:hypothetical protein